MRVLSTWHVSGSFICNGDRAFSFTFGLTGTLIGLCALHFRDHGLWEDLLFNAEFLI